MTNPTGAAPDLPAVPPPPEVMPEASPAGGVASAAVIFQGPVSLWIGLRAFLGAGVALLAGSALWIYGLYQPPYWAKQVFVSAGQALLFAAILILPFLIFSIRCLRYKITTRLIEREKGWIFKRVDSLDLARVKDVELTQSLLQRIVRTGTLEIFSSDQTDGVMRIEELPNPRPIYEKLRDAILAVSQRRGVIPLDR